ncbi:MBL fold metallo-hydrolase [Rhodococcus sp. 06-470-2]|uniref:MBL fold metallo-hydrolase n=1 Tax=unclassified Rhodococcus (in: high G+C Gram-positive bacteria) TaxID=192944 RepID=UPI000B9BDDBA|nr:MULTISPECIES: MBL fold metallo-hydrolase [unclassified Rhodococcus (in: high G+C Gram-positive bacteria)]OZC59492.1 MBL fold metallo-hydrolase [Rhodococcus sp. 06-470-2]OZE57191.1 MBL fold metallo-hydrolase [Rhodococcus sp. 05-2221-1B]
MSDEERSGRCTVITLGTCGGPKLRVDRTGVSTAIVVDDAVYIVDLGYGASRQLIAAGYDFSQVRGIFVTHLHSDHISDLANVLLYGWYQGLSESAKPVTMLGPGSRGALAPAHAFAQEPAIVNPEDPTPGFAESYRYLLQAHSTDINDRIRDNLRPHPDEVLTARNIEIPFQVGFDPDTNNAPEMEPFEIYADEHVRVFATLVEHSPMSPAFAFRFETASGSVVVSGDTGPCANLERLAAGVDVLVHEVIDEQWAERNYADKPEAERQAMMLHHLSAHTSIEEVGKIAQRASVGTLVLNHFVPGHLVPGRWHEAGLHFDGTLIVAQDLDRIDVDAGRSARV